MQATEEISAQPAAEGDFPIKKALILLAIIAAIIIFAALWQNGVPAAPAPAPEEQPAAPAPNGPAAKPVQTNPGLDILNASKDGGGYYIVIGNSEANITGISINGTYVNYTVVRAGAKILVKIPAPVDCSSISQLVFVADFALSGQSLSQTEQIRLAGCSSRNTPEEIEPLPQCKGASEPCFGNDCCEGMACNSDGFCATMPNSCAPDGQSCGAEACCDGLECDGGTNTCRPAPGCAAIRRPCKSASDCCARNPASVCRDLICRFCSSENEVCTADSDCCANGPPMVCVGNVCAPS